METFLFALFAWSTMGVVGIFIARGKGINESTGCLWGIFLGPIGWLIVAMMTDGPGKQRAIARLQVKCPYCAEFILEEAAFCKHCGRGQPERQHETIPQAPPPSRSIPATAAIKPQSHNDHSTAKIATATIFIILVVIVVIGLVFKSPSSTPPGSENLPSFHAYQWVLIRPAKLKTRGPIPMYEGNALIFSNSSCAKAYLRYLRDGNLSKAGELLTDSCLLPVDRPIKAILKDYDIGDNGEGPSNLDIDLESLPPTWDKAKWRSWRNCWVFNEHIEPLTESKR